MQGQIEQGRAGQGRAVQCSWFYWLGKYATLEES